MTDGQEARRHGLLNARENYKHRYAFMLLGQLYDGLERALVDALEGHQAQLQALEDAQRLLLGSAARRRRKPCWRPSRPLTAPNRIALLSRRRALRYGPGE